MVTVTEVNRNPDGNFNTISFKDVDEDPITISSATSPVDVDFNESNWYAPIELTENVTVNLNNPSPGGNSMLLYFTDGDGAGPYTVSYTNDTVNENGGSVDKEVPQNGNLRHSLTSDDGGTTYRLTKSGGGFA